MFKDSPNQKSKMSQEEEEGNEVHLGHPCGRQKLKAKNSIYALVLAFWAWKRFLVIKSWRANSVLRNFIRGLVTELLSFCPISREKGPRVWVVSENDNRGGKMAQHYESLGKKSSSKWGSNFYIFFTAPKVTLQSYYMNSKGLQINPLKSTSKVYLHIKAQTPNKSVYLTAFILQTWKLHLYIMHRHLNH